LLTPGSRDSQGGLGSQKKASGASTSNIISANMCYIKAASISALVRAQAALLFEPCDCDALAARPSHSHIA
jgi:hypothetical protein